MSLTAGSLTMFTSLNTLVPVPSSKNTAYPTIEHLPSLTGALHSTVIVEMLDVYLNGALNPDSKMHAVNSKMSDVSPVH
jgi:hypothetical protein